MHKLFANLKLGLTAIVVAAGISTKAYAVPDEPPAQVQTHETYPYIIRMNSGDEYFVSRANEMLTLHNSSGTGIGWIDGRNVMLNTANYSIDRPLGEGMHCADCIDNAHAEHWELFKPRRLVSGTALEGMLMLNTELRQPCDETPPEFRIQNESDLQGNSFLQNASPLVEIESEPGVVFVVRDNNFVQGSCSARTRTFNFPLHLNGEGNHFVEISATDLAGNTSVHSMSVGIGARHFSVSGIEFRTCGRAYEQYSQDSSLYEHLASVMHCLNVNIRNRDQYVRRINIPYLTVVQFSVPPNSSVVVEHGGTRDGCHIARDFIFIGHGNFNQYNDSRRRLRDVYTHEFGHHVFDTLPECDRMAFSRIYEDIKSSNLMVCAPLFNRLFCDGAYEERPDVGHPWDNAHELFASAYHISTNYLNELLSALPAHDAKVQMHARRIIDFVIRYQAH